MKTKILMFISSILMMYVFAFYSGYLIEQSNYSLSGVNIVNTILYLWFVINLIKKEE